jgi:hypothetical protein
MQSHEPTRTSARDHRQRGEARAVGKEGNQMSEPTYISNNNHTISNPNTQIMRVDLDGGFHVNESIPATDAAKEVLRIMKEQWFADVQATKIRELESDVNELKELNEYLRDRIKRLKEAGDVLAAAASFMGWHSEIEKWNKAKEAKP